MAARIKPPNAGTARKSSLAALVIGVVALALSLGLCFTFFGSSPRTLPTSKVLPTAGKAAARSTDDAFFATFGKSPGCKSCHEEAYANWENSHHALAERELNPALDREAFDPAWHITHGSQTSFAHATNGQFQVVTLGPRNVVEPFLVARVLGVSPLRQYLVPFPGGRFQMTLVAFYPQHPDWFYVYGGEDR